MNKESIELIKGFEGCKLNSYLCPANVWTIGYGHTKGVKRGDKIDQSQAEAMLKADLAEFEVAVDSLVSVSINDNQRGALVSFAYNVGVGALKKSTLLKKLNNKDYQGAANQFLRWNKSGGRPLPGLTRRREAERRLFLS